jgi:hypothetical protein
MAWLKNIVGANHAAAEALDLPGDDDGVGLDAEACAVGDGDAPALVVSAPDGAGEAPSASGLGVGLDPGLRESLSLVSSVVPAPAVPFFKSRVLPD